MGTGLAHGTLVESSPPAPQAPLAVERLLVAVLFCDLRGFTPLAAVLDPARVHELLTCYYEALSPAVIACGGTVVQYTGDEIFAVFCGARSASAVVGSALDAALAMCDRLPHLNRELATRGLPPLALGIGLHVGDVVSAPVGNGAARQHSFFGHAVNLGRRLCSVAHDGEIVVSASFHAASRRAATWRLASAELKGIVEHVDVVVLDPSRTECAGPFATTH